MCRICEGDFPREPTARVLELAALAEKVCNFGAMHIVVEDGNVESENIEWCLSQPDVTEDDIAFGTLALQCTEDERVSAIAKKDGRW